MDKQFQWHPEQASTFAPAVDSLYFFLLAVTAFFTIGIFLMILYFGLKYRRRPGVRPVPVKTSNTLEYTWTVIPFLLTLVMFAWGAALYVHTQRPPEGAMEINVVGKQWMWKIQHPEGRREINELHVPLGRPIKLNLTSQDVIHDFSMPAFRIKQDIVPGRYVNEWFQPTQVGKYHLFCAEYCGTQHSGMIGYIYVMDPAKYQAWLSGSTADLPPAESGERLFTQYQCNTCHGQRAPTLAGLYGRRVQLADGSVITADEDYIRESILNPSAKMVAGYAPLMPTYAGQLSEEQVLELVTYIKSLSTATTQPADHVTD